MYETCPTCGSPTEARRNGPTGGTYCTKCDWAVVTTMIDPIDQDRTIYALRLIRADLHDERHVRAIAAVTGLNFVQARRVAGDDASPVLCNERARRIAEAMRMLSDAGVSFEVAPPFKH